jgi:hypothetical protein
MADQENFNVLGFMHSVEIRRRIFIEGDGAGQSPDLLQPEKHHLDHH